MIIQALQGLTRIAPFVNPGFPPVNRAEDNRKLDDSETLRNLQSLRAGDIAYGYIQAREPFLSLLTQPKYATIFVYRDPRDMLVSHVFYATQMHRGHGMHEYYTQRLRDMEQRLNAAIYGVDEPDARLSGVRQKYLDYLGWLETPGILCLRFEDLILNRRQALNRILDYLGERGFELRVTLEQAILALEEAIVPKRSGTFRKAQPGNWREYFSEANKKAFKNVAGDLLIRLGYEKDNNW
ncbi:MAG: sulfotransferase domain-containing protein [Anaerolineales bacterium]|nr:sulfotransferase domain-containing protein [Anaerolineales bacterium]